MSEGPLISIIINNYNYGFFLKEAIDSALNQTYNNKEIIVVDDGSSDNSRQIINSFGTRVISIFKANGGQASTLNTGFYVSHGKYILFLDSDDMLFPSALQAGILGFRNVDVIKVHWQSIIIDKSGNSMESFFPKDTLPEGDLFETILTNGPEALNSAPTSGNLWSRKYLEQVFPIPVESFKISADLYLYMLAPLFGRINFLNEPQTFYRIHGTNNILGSVLKEEKILSMTKQFDQASIILNNFLTRIGFTPNVEDWKCSSWSYRLFFSLNDIKQIISENKIFILVDENKWNVSKELAHRRVLPFIERNGQFWGYPSDDLNAINELERMRTSGASAIIFTWDSFWWLDFYKGFKCHLESNYIRLLDNDRLICYQL